MTQQVKYVLSIIRKMGVTLQHSTIVNSQLLFNTTKKNVKVLIDPNTLSFDVIEISDFYPPRYLASNFYFNTAKLIVAAKVIAYHTGEEAREVIAA